MSYVTDLLLVWSRYPCALQRPYVYFGNFPRTEEGALFQSFTDYLHEEGFQREVFQLIFPKQCYGVVRDEGNEQESHIRFFKDKETMSMACEVEGKRLSAHHFEHAQDGTSFLEQLIEESPFPADKKEQLYQSIQYRNFHEESATPLFDGGEHYFTDVMNLWLAAQIPFLLFLSYMFSA